MDFATLPPEINSERMYAGPGDESLVEAVTAWNKLAVCLYTAAADYRAVTAKLAAICGDRPVIAEAATPYPEWLDSAGEQAERTAEQATSALRAYRSVFAATVPPPVIEANRARRLSTAATNQLGQESASVADIDAEYEDMWVQNATAMYAYASASAQASTLTPFKSPPCTAAPEIVSTGYEVMAKIPEALQSLSSSPLASPLETFGKHLSSVTASLSKLSSLTTAADYAISYLNNLNKLTALSALLPHGGRVSTSVFSAALGRSSHIGASSTPLSVPARWVSQTTDGYPWSTELPGGWIGEPIHLVRTRDAPGRPLEGRDVGRADPAVDQKRRRGDE